METPKPLRNQTPAHSATPAKTPTKTPTSCQGGSCKVCKPCAFMVAAILMIIALSAAGGGYVVFQKFEKKGLLIYTMIVFVVAAVSFAPSKLKKKAKNE